MLGCHEHGSGTAKTIMAHMQSEACPPQFCVEIFAEPSIEFEQGFTESAQSAIFFFLRLLWSLRSNHGLIDDAKPWLRDRW